MLERKNSINIILTLKTKIMVMYEVDVDSAELSDFAKTVSESGMRYQEMRTSLRAKLDELKADGWADDKYLEFSAIFQESEKSIVNIEEVLAYLEEYLRKKIAILEAYHSSSLM